MKPGTLFAMLRWTVLAFFLALVVPAGGAFALPCPTPSATAMPCCELGMDCADRTPDCCGVAPGAEGPDRPLLSPPSTGVEGSRIRWTSPIPVQPSLQAREVSGVAARQLATRRASTRVPPLVSRGTVLLI
jgi:hypothetical protein